MSWDAIMWLVVLILCFMVEASTVALVSLWFAAGALVAMLAAVLGAPLWLQFLLFGIISIGLLLALRPFLRKFHNPKMTATNVDAVVGSQGVVVEDINNIQGQGRVKLGGMEWSARSTNQANIPAGTIILVDRVEGVKVYVTPVETKI